MAVRLERLRVSGETIKPDSAAVQLFKACKLAFRSFEGMPREIREVFGLYASKGIVDPRLSMDHQTYTELLERLRRDEFPVVRAPHVPAEDKGADGVIITATSRPVQKRKTGSKPKTSASRGPASGMRYLGLTPAASRTLDRLERERGRLYCEFQQNGDCRIRDPKNNPDSPRYIGTLHRDGTFTERKPQRQTAIERRIAKMPDAAREAFLKMRAERGELILEKVGSSYRVRRHNPHTARKDPVATIYEDGVTVMAPPREDHRHGNALPIDTVNIILTHHAAGMNDAEIAKLARVSTKSVQRIRRDRGLMPNRRRSRSEDGEQKAVRANELGMSLNEAAEYSGLGKSRVAEIWGEKGLKPNNPPPPYLRRAGESADNL